jgi:hypothetical protein
MQIPTEIANAINKFFSEAGVNTTNIVSRKDFLLMQQPLNVSFAEPVQLILQT